MNLRATVELNYSEHDKLLITVLLRDTLRKESVRPFEVIPALFNRKFKYFFLILFTWFK